MLGGQGGVGFLPAGTGLQFLLPNVRVSLLRAGLPDTAGMKNQAAPVAASVAFSIVPTAVLHNVQRQ